MMYMFAHAVHPNWKKNLHLQFTNIKLHSPSSFLSEWCWHTHIPIMFWPDIPQAPCWLGKQMKCPPVTIDQRTGPQYFIKWYAYISRELVRPAENCGWQIDLPLLRRKWVKNSLSSMRSTWAKYCLDLGNFHLGTVPADPLSSSSLEDESFTMAVTATATAAATVLYLSASITNS